MNPPANLHWCPACHFAAVGTSCPECRGPLAPLERSRKRSKWGNRPVCVDGIRFDSGHEAARWTELRLLERAARITELRRQVPFRLTVNGQLVCSYIADFVYVESGREIVEDAKSAATRKIATYRIKRKLMAACHGIEIREV